MNKISEVNKKDLSLEEFQDFIHSEFKDKLKTDKEIIKDLESKITQLEKTVEMFKNLYDKTYKDLCVKTKQVHEQQTLINSLRKLIYGLNINIVNQNTFEAVMVETNPKKQYLMRYLLSKYEVGILIKNHFISKEE